MRTILVHVNVELDDDDTRTVDEIVTEVVGHVPNADVAVPLAEEV